MAPVKGESVGLLHFIRLVVSCSRLIIIGPALLVFILGYSTTYDYTVHSINSLFAKLHLHQINVPQCQFPQLEPLNWANHSLSVVTLAHENVLSFDVLKNVSWAQAQVDSAVTVLSPVTQWGLDYVQAPDFKTYLLQKINYDSSYLLTSVYLDELSHLNHLVVAANKLKLYLVHPTTVSVDFVAAWPHFHSVDTVSDPRLVSDFVHYFLTIQPDHFKWSARVSDWVVAALVALFVLHIYLAVSNLYKIKSSFGLVFGWLIEVFMSMSASISIVSFFYVGGSIKHWKQLFEPTTTFSQAMYFLTVALLSSRNLIRIINDLSLEYNQQDANLQSVLYRFYTGIANNFNREDQSKLIVFRRIARKLKILSVVQKLKLDTIKVPSISKVLAIDIVSLWLMKWATILVLRAFFTGNFLCYFELKISRFFLICSVALFIDHLMQLTYLVGVVLIDLHKNEVTDILNDNVRTHYNIFSKHLLNFNIIDDSDRRSLRYKLGTWLLLVRYPTSMKSWIICFPIIQSISTVIILLSWSLLIPYRLINENLDLLSFTSLKLVHNGANFLYYLEFLSIIVIIIASSMITFELSDFKINEKEKAKFDSIQLSDEKVFNSIDLDSHSLDLIKIRTNATSSFLISVGLDHKVLVWSPMKVPSTHPTNIASKITINSKEFEFWPINHVSLNNDGNFIVLMNFKYKAIRCYSRALLNFSWSKKVNNEINFEQSKIVESFFREKTVPAFLKRRMMQNRQKSIPLSRRNSVSSAIGNFPNLISTTADEDKNSLLKYEFVMVMNTGQLITYACEDGSEVVINVINDFYDADEPDVDALRLVSVKKIMTPRVNDRIVCQVSNGDIIVAIAVNNKWRLTKLDLQVDYYDKITPVRLMALPMSTQNSINYDFEAAKKVDTGKQFDSSVRTRNIDHSKTFIYPIQFVGMIVRVNNSVAELIDVQTGIVLMEANIGYFKPSSFRVAHSEPTHCRFCGCASIQSFSLIYEEFDSKTLIVHTFKIKEARSKTNICLRVERDPREIRCAGFNSATEDQFWYTDIDGWEVTDVNMILGVKKELEDIETIPEYRESSGAQIHSGFNAIKSSKKPQERETERLSRAWEGFVITLSDGHYTSYEIPNLSKDLIMNKIHCVEKFGFKSIAVGFGRQIKILYLGNNNLIEENLYFNDSETPTGKAAANKPINNELLFINKRRKFKGK